MCSRSWSDGSGLGAEADPSDELEMMMRVLNDMPASVGNGLRDSGRADPPWGGTPVQCLDVWPQTPDRTIDLFPEALERQAPLGLYSYQPDPATSTYRLALISPATEKTISSTLGELGHLKASVTLHPIEASSRNLADGDRVRIFNDLGEMRCVLAVDRNVRTGVAVVPKGLWCRSSENGATANALAPDTLSDIGGGACFNDARVEVAKLEE